ncbi:MAG: discoidin domain-containing protein [Acidimicrobiia bacterium]|nr:discoidin domain-containing protein [Acidimicrobiia bacterium]
MWVQPEHVIGIVGDGFVDVRTGEPFVPRGANYLTRVLVGGGYQDRTLSPAVFDRDRTDGDFAELSERGYNVVRVFLDTCSSGPACAGNPSGAGLNPAYLDTIVEFMEVARDRGIFILFTSNDLPDQGGYWAISDEDNVEGVFPGYRNSHYLTASGERAAVTYWGDLLAGLVERQAPFDVVLAWSILNEQWMFTDQPPLSLAEGEVTTKTGTYDMADPAARRQMVVDGMRSYLASVTDEIKRFDPTGLVTSGFFAPQFPNPTGIGGSWYVDTAPLVVDSALDFFDFHAYPGEDIPMDQIAENFGLPSDKPVILGEYGAFIDRYPEIDGAAIATQAWVAQSCDVGFDGWLYWEYAPASLSVGDATWALIADDDLLLDAFSPAAQPDPCIPTLVDPNIAVGADVSASRSLPDEPAVAAVDGNPATQWGSGAEPRQWIEIDLGADTEIGSVELLVAQFPEGRTVHVISIDGVEVHTFEGDTAENDVLAWSPDMPIAGQVIRVTTTVSPSWVSWKEVRILRP